MPKQLKSSRVYLLAFAFILCLMGSFYVLFVHIHQSHNQWKNYTQLEMEKSKHLNQAILISGYGGFIHNFKNAVLRRDPQYLAQAEIQIKTSIDALDKYLALTPQHVQQVMAIQHVISQYQAKLPLLKQLIIRGADVENIDQQVKVNDALAIKALRDILNSSQTHPLTMLQKTEDAYYASVQSLLIILNLLFFFSLAVIGVTFYLHKSLAEQLMRQDMIFNCAPSAILGVDQHGTINAANHEAMTLFGFDQQAINQLNVEQLVPEHLKNQYQQMREQLNQSHRLKPATQRDIDFQGMKLNGEIFPARIAIAAYRVAKQKHSIVVVNDLTQERQALTEAATDPLTQLANRRAINQQLTASLAKVKRHGTALSICLFDIDHFKRINDKHGHLVGDEVLQQVANVMQDNAREVDFIGRWGGEEFIAILEGTNKQGALDFAEKIRTQIRAQSQTDRFPAAITVSAGVAQCIIEMEPNSLLAHADEALYCSKHKGRDCVSSHSFMTSPLVDSR